MPLFQGFPQYDPNEIQSSVLSTDGFAEQIQMSCPACSSLMKEIQPMDRTQQLYYKCKSCGLEVNPNVKNLKRAAKTPTSVQGDNAFAAARGENQALSVDESFRLDDTGIRNLQMNIEKHDVLTAPGEFPREADPNQIRTRNDYLARQVNRNLGKNESDMIITDVK